MNESFVTILEKAIQLSRGDENYVLGMAEELLEKGCDPKEIYASLTHLHDTREHERDKVIVEEALEEFSQYIS